MKVQKWNEMNNTVQDMKVELESPMNMQTGSKNVES